MMCESACTHVNSVTALFCAYVTSSKPSAVSRRSGKSFTSLYVWRKTSRVQRAAPSVLGLVKNGPAFQRR